MSCPQLHKVLTNPKGGQRLGTSLATWNKIKQATSDSKPKDHESLAGVVDTENSSLNPPSLRLVENGPNGELCIWYQAEYAYEIWGWSNVSSYSRFREEGAKVSYDFVQANLADSGTYSGDTLSLLTKFVAPGRQVKAMKFMSTAEGPVFTSVYSCLGKLYLEARADKNVQEMVLPGFLQEDEIMLKASLKFLVVSSAKGLLYVLKYAPNKHNGLFQEANADGSLQSVYSHSTRGLVEKHKLAETSNSTVLLKTGTFDGSAVYDIVGTWLVYCPKRVETEYFRNLMYSGDETLAKSSKTSGSSASKLYTSVKVPPNAPILVRAASSLANTAIDNIFKLSQLGTKKMRTYWNPENNLFDKDISLHAISSSIGNALYSTATKIKKHADLIGENEIVKIIDLSNGQIMATFKPPGGISYLSLSEYDLQLAQATYRGDHFYIWDLYQLPKEVSFAGKFVRGKTSAVIKEIFWFVNNKTLEGLQVTNSGFGCITKKTGSIHWYNINYIFCANENDNFPNTLDILSLKAPKNGQFLDSWVLPSSNAVKLLKLPNSSNIPSDMSGEEASVLKLCSHSRRCNQLAYIDCGFNLRLVSPLNGKHTFKYKLNDCLSVGLQTKEGSKYATWIPFTKEAYNVGEAQPNLETPLSQTEIETCAPFTSITNDRNVAISSFNIKGDAKDVSFWDSYVTFGNEIPVMVHEFTGTTEYGTPLTSTEDLSDYVNDPLLTDSNREAEGVVFNQDTEQL